MYAFEGTQKIADIRPESFDGVDVDFKKAIVIADQFVRLVTDCRVRSDQVAIVGPVIDVGSGT